MKRQHPLKTMSIQTPISQPSPDQLSSGNDSLAELRNGRRTRASSKAQDETGADDRIRCATYNVNDKLPPKGTTELASLVGDGSDDLLVFGFQEAGASDVTDYADCRCPSSGFAVRSGKR